MLDIGAENYPFPFALLKDSSDDPVLFVSAHTSPAVTSISSIDRLATILNTECRTARVEEPYGQRETGNGHFKVRVSHTKV